MRASAAMRGPYDIHVPQSSFPEAGAPTAQDWGRAADTIGYEIITRIGPRVAREYV